MGFFSLFNKSKTSTAFSCDNGFLRYVALVKKNNLIEIERYGSEWLGPEILSDHDEIVSEVLYLEKLQKIAREKNITEANLVVPDHQAIMFHTHVIKEPAGEMNDVITDHIKTYCRVHQLLTFTDYICEYDVILEMPFGYDIHVTLVPKVFIHNFKNLFQRAGIALRHIETAHHAVARACLGMPTGRGYLAVLLGQRITTATLVHGNHAVSHHRAHVGINNLATTTEHFLNITSEEANKILMKYGILKTHPDTGLLGELYLTLEPVWHTIHQQMVDHGQLPYKTFGHRFVTEKIVIYGEGVQLKGIAAFLEEKIGMPCTILDVWQGRTDRAPIMQLPAEETCTYAECLSLALLYLD